ncbi:MAG: elongation factor Ts [Candidatus Zambryskibacteria bacterium]|nr:elongation factor Ts [Candidatus Zambryskibacteria bacterium]
MEITTELIKTLRDKTGVSVMQCKKALEEAGGDMEKAVIILQKRSAESALKKSDRELGAGIVESYIHSTKTVGAMVELMCETDFVSGNEEFKKLAYDIAMHIAAANPRYLKKEEISEESRAKAMEVFAPEVEGKPEELKEKILSGKLDSFFNEQVLLEQPFIKNGDLTIKNLIEAGTQKFGEKIEISRFVRFGVK